MPEQATVHASPKSDIASAQKLVLLAFVVGVVGGLYPPVLLVAIAFMSYAVYRLATVLGMSAWSIVFFLIAMWIPILGLVCLLVLNASATRTLREAGVPVGLLGAKRADLEAVHYDAPKTTAEAD